MLLIFKITSTTVFLGWCLVTAMAWRWWTTSKKRCYSTWARRSCTARRSPTRGSLAPRAKLASPLEVRNLVTQSQLLYHCLLKKIKNKNVSLLFVTFTSWMASQSWACNVELYRQLFISTAVYKLVNYRGAVFDPPLLKAVI